jgi:hypothetical protein
LNKSLLVSGLVLGIIGAILDFYSGSAFLSMSMSTTTMMGVTTTHYNGSAQYWGIFLLFLGIALLLTAGISITSYGLRQMALFGMLMMGFGVVMFAVGALMYSGITPMMPQQSTTLVSSLGMFGVGALMLVNGSFMAMRRMSTSPTVKM